MAAPACAPSQPPQTSFSDCLLAIFLPLLFFIPFILAGYGSSIFDADIRLRERAAAGSSGGSGGDGGSGGRNGGGNHRGDSDGSEVLEAATRGELDRLRSLLRVDREQQKRLLESHDAQGRTPLSCAAYFGHPKLVNYLLKKFPYTLYSQDTDSDKSYPIHQACIGGNIDVIREFYSHCTENSSDRRSFNLMFFSHNQQNRTIIHLAAYDGKASVVEYLISLPESASQITVQDATRRTPKQLAEFKGHGRVARMLQ